MNKRKFIGLLAAVMMVVAGVAINVNHSTSVSGLSDVFLANVEVLANETGGSSSSWTCWSAVQKGDGCWICGNPCVYESKKSPSGGKSECFAE
jgi:hypothetical protein